MDVLSYPDQSECRKKRGKTLGSNERREKKGMGE